MFNRVALSILNRQKLVFERVVRSCAENQLRDRSAAGQWSILEIVDHLQKVELAFATEMSKRGDGDVAVVDFMKGIFVVGIMFLPIRVSVPNGAPVLPEQPRDCDTAIAAWNESRNSLLAVVRKLTKEQEGKALVRHPASGEMNLSLALWFLASHLVHHRHQLRRFKTVNR